MASDQVSTSTTQTIKRVVHLESSLKLRAHSKYEPFRQICPHVEECVRLSSRARLSEAGIIRQIDINNQSTRRTERSRSSLGYFLGAGTTPSSQGLESPPNPGRFTVEPVGEPTRNMLVAMRYESASNTVARTALSFALPIRLTRQLSHHRREAASLPHPHVLNLNSWHFPLPQVRHGTCAKAIRAR
jgi:hypothetical protein